MEIGVDKLYHFIVGVLICMFSYFVLRMTYNKSLSLIVANTIVIAAGVAKEVKDYYSYGRFDIFDLLATIIGGFVLTLYIILS